MYLGAGETLCGDETIDAVRGAVEVVHSIRGATLDIKVARIKMVLPLLPIADLSGQRYSMNSLRAFIRTDERPPDFREQIADAEFYGETGLVGSMFRYLYNDDEEPPVDDLSLSILNPVFVGFNVAEELGLEHFSLQVPMRDIVFAQKIPALV